MTTKPIRRFNDEYYFLSNFWVEPVVLTHPDHPGGSATFKSAEHAYQAFKATNADDFERIRQAPTPGLAKRIGNAILIEPDWEKIKIPAMRLVLSFKFAPGTNLANQLLATADAELIEGNTWGDRFWGVCRGEGENHLGKLLMRQREILQQQKETI